MTLTLTRVRPSVLSTYFIFCITLVGYGRGYAQQGELLYGFDRIPQSMLLNPSHDFKHTWTVGIPLLSNLKLSVVDGGFSIEDINGSIIPLFGKTKDDFMKFEQRVELLHLGGAITLGGVHSFHLSGGAYQHFHGYSFYPKDVMDLLFTGNVLSFAQSIFVDSFIQDGLSQIINPEFSFGTEDVNMQLFINTVYHVGLAYKYKDWFHLGARLKVYNNSGYWGIVDSDLSMTYTPTSRSNLRIKGDGSLRIDNANGMTPLNAQAQFATIDMNDIWSGNFGYGIDVGIHSYVTPNIFVSFSAIDIGFINFATETSRREIEPDVSFEGTDAESLFDPNVNNAPTSLQNALNSVVSSYSVLDVEEIDSYRRFLPLSYYISTGYTFYRTSYNPRVHDASNHEKQTIALLLHGFVMEDRIQHSVTASYYDDRDPLLKWKLYYSVSRANFINVGGGIVYSLTPTLQLYTLLEDVIGWTTISGFRGGLQLGLNYVY